MTRTAPTLKQALAAVTLTLAPAVALAADGGASPAAQLVRLVGGLVLVIATVFVLSRVLPRFGGAALTGQRGFRVLASLPVGQRERVVLMEVGDRQIVVGVAPGRVSRLHEPEAPIEVGAANRASAADGPQGWLARTLKGRP